MQGVNTAFKIVLRKTFIKIADISKTAVMAKGFPPYSVFFVRIAILVGCFVAINKMSGFFESIGNSVNILLKNISRCITLEMRERFLGENPWSLMYVPDHFKTTKMCKRVVEGDPYMLKFVSDHINTKEMFERAAEKTRRYWNSFWIIIRPNKCVTRQ